MNDDKKKIGDWQQETYKLRSEAIDLNEQIKEMQLIIDTANEKLKENKTSSFADVVSSFEPSKDEMNRARYNYTKTQFKNPDAVNPDMEAFFNNYFHEGALWMYNKLKAKH